MKRDPTNAIRFFRSVRDDALLTDLDRSAIDEWISGADDWKTTQAEDSSGIRAADQLFYRGSRYFNSGMSKEKMGGIGFARADYDIASGYLRRFALLHDKDPQIGEVLYMLGKIRGATRADPEQWSDNFFLKEVIRRFPHTQLARRSYDLLRKELTAAYHPESIPEDVVGHLNEYEELSRLSAPPQ